MLHQTPRIGLAALALGLAACGSVDQDTSARVALEREYDATLAELSAAIGEARADELAACRVLALGEDACGNPSLYRVYSVSDGDSARIQAFAHTFVELDRRWSAMGYGPVCRDRTPPTPELTDGRCGSDREPVIVVD